MTVQPYNPQQIEKHPVSALEWRPWFEKAYAEYTLGQKGAVTRYDVRFLFEYMQTTRRKDFPAIDSEREETHVRKLLYGFLAEKFGPLFDGTIYHEHRSRGRSILVGTEDASRLIAGVKG